MTTPLIEFMVRRREEKKLAIIVSCIRRIICGILQIIRGVLQIFRRICISPFSRHFVWKTYFTFLWKRIAVCSCSFCEEFFSISFDAEELCGKVCEFVQSANWKRCC